MAIARLDGSAIIDWDTFHSVCAQEFGFPDFYGRNGNAWIDCLTYVDEGDGMCRFVLKPGETLRIELIGSASLRERQPEIVEALIDWTSAANERFVERGESRRLTLDLL